MTRSGFITSMSWPVWIWRAVTSPGPVACSTMRLGPSPCMRRASCLMLSTMSVTSSRTPGIELNSCSTPSICTEITAAPCSDDSRMRRIALPSVMPKPRSSGSATIVATRDGSAPGSTSSFSGLIRLCQFLWSATRDPLFSSTAKDRTLARPARKCRRSAEDQTRRRLRGRHPLCGIGVMSRIAVIEKPTAWSARSALSRPEPGPDTSISRVSMPCSLAFLPASSAATWAAYGVDFRLPLKTLAAGRRPRDRVALGVRDGDHRVVERGQDMRHAGDDVLAFLLTGTRCCCGSRHVLASCG